MGSTISDMGSDLVVLPTRSAGHRSDLSPGAHHRVPRSASPVLRRRRRPADADTYATPDSWDAALMATGAGMVAIDTLHERGEGVAFVAARPPGHHALADQSMGFCLINNVAVAAAVWPLPVNVC